ncbi:hypothetical protein [Cytobacillus horneckiae]|uniref:hypothetical protein n=1 Tax=Cytobacillus horneckiae TaxID=549687 RepID=UPI00130441F5|nr:hypothetical protein [Cytobacillus horneckiae]
MNWTLPFGLTVGAFWTLYLTTQLLSLSLIGGAGAFAAGILCSIHIMKKGE